MLDAIFIILLVLLMILLPGGILLHTLFLQRLRQKYPQIWESLGRPTMVLNNTIRNSFAAQRFLRRREYESLGDPRFSKFCNILRLYTRFYTIVLLGLVVCILVAGIAARTGWG